MWFDRDKTEPDPDLHSSATSVRWVAGFLKGTIRTPALPPAGCLGIILNAKRNEKTR